MNEPIKCCLHKRFKVQVTGDSAGFVWDQTGHHPADGCSSLLRQQGGAVTFLASLTKALTVFHGVYSSALWVKQKPQLSGEDDEDEEVPSAAVPLTATRCWITGWNLLKKSPKVYIKIIFTPQEADFINWWEYQGFKKCLTFWKICWFIFLQRFKREDRYHSHTRLQQPVSLA